tara:strand:+ start:171 stop:506 length:336 start_codon:yes stop_codon:yes gene_type:complete
MLTLEEILLKEIEEYIRKDNIDELIRLSLLIHNYDIEKRISTSYIFQKSFFKACKYGTQRVILWMSNIFDNLDEIEKMSIRPLFKYGSHLIRKRKIRNLHEWYHNNVLLKH